MGIRARVTERRGRERGMRPTGVGNGERRRRRATTSGVCGGGERRERRRAAKRAAVHVNRVRDKMVLNYDVETHVNAFDRTQLTVSRRMLKSCASAMLEKTRRSSPSEPSLAEQVNKPPHAHRFPR